MKHILITTGLIVLSLTGPAAGFGSEPSLSGEVTIGATVAESSDFAWAQLYAENRLKLSASAGDVWITAEAYLEVSALDEAPYSVRPGELYLDWGHASGRTTIGRQIITWGRMDALSILDLISPPDTERLFTGRGTPDPLPVLAVQWSRDIPQGILELLYIPLSPVGATDPDSDIGGDIDVDLYEGEAGVRLRWFLPFADAGISAFSGRDRSPVVVGLPPAVRHHRLTVLGFDAAIPIGATVVRFESGLFPDRRFTPAEPGNSAVRATQLQAAAGIDWMPANWRFITEIRGGILPYTEGAPADGAHLIDYGAELVRTFRQGEIELFLQGLYQQHHKNLYLQAGTIWQPPAGPTVEIGVEYLHGSDGLFALREDGALPYIRMRLPY